MGDILESSVSNVMGITVLEKERGKKMTREIIARNCLLQNWRWGMANSGKQGLGFAGCVFKLSIFFY